VTELDIHALQWEERPFKAHWPQLKRIGLLLPILKHKRIGRFFNLDVEYVVETLNYERRDRELLELFDRGRLAFYLYFRRTGYFRNQHRGKGRSTLWTFRRMNRQFRLLRSIRKHGLHSDPERVEDLAWMFCAENVFFRLDGHHRVAVARYLGYQEVPVMVVTPRDLLELPETPRSLIGYLEGLGEPSYLPEPRA
jgi:hypothetical protein